MPGSDIITLIAQNGGLLGAFIFSVWMINKVWEARLDEAKRNAAAESEMRAQMQDALNRNTEAMTRLCERLEK